MTDPGARVPATCPSCSPDVETVHEVLKDGGQATVRCAECGHVHKTTIEEQTEVRKDVVVSQDGDSFTTSVEAPPDQDTAVGEEFIVESEEGIFTVRITSLEVGDARKEEAQIADVDTFWTRAVGNVRVPVTVHPRDGNRDESRSVDLYVPGDYEFTVGESEAFGDEEFTVQGIHIRTDAHGYDFDKLDRDGDQAIAKDVNRLYARDETTTAWSAW